MIYSRLTFQQPETLNHYRFQQTTVYCLMHISTYPMNSHNCRKYIWTVAENAYACKLKLVLDIDSYWRNVHRRMHLHLHINSCLWPLIMSTVVGNYADDTPNYSRKMHAWGAWKKNDVILPFIESTNIRYVQGYCILCGAMYTCFEWNTRILLEHFAICIYLLLPRALFD